ncbi:MAG: GntR family transcriptional regulator [Pusillimonas sp.]
MTNTQKLRRGRLRLHIQVADILRDKIIGGEFSTSTPLPTETELMRDFGVSRTVVRQAMQSIETLGLVRRIAGKGTFVRDSSQYPFEGWSINSAADLVRYGTQTKLEILDRLEVPAPREVADALTIEPNTLVSKIRAVRSSGQGRFAYQINYALLDIGRRVAAQPIISSMLLAYQEHGLVELLHLRQAISAVAADNHVAKILEVSEGDPLLQFEWSMIATNGCPATFSHVFFRSDRYRHVTKLLPGAG